MVKITVDILGRTYNLQVREEDVNLLQSAAQTIEKQVRAFAGRYEYKDYQDLLVMVALVNITKLMQQPEASATQDGDLERRLQSIDEKLNQLLHPSQNSL